MSKRAPILPAILITLAIAGCNARDAAESRCRHQYGSRGAMNDACTSGIDFTVRAAYSEMHSHPEGAGTVTFLEHVRSVANAQCDLAYPAGHGSVFHTYYDACIQGVRNALIHGAEALAATMNPTRGRNTPHRGSTL